MTARKKPADRTKPSLPPQGAKPPKAAGAAKPSAMQTFCLAAAIGLELVWVAALAAMALAK